MVIATKVAHERIKTGNNKSGEEEKAEKSKEERIQKRKKTLTVRSDGRISDLRDEENVAVLMVNNSQKSMINYQ